MYWLLNFCGKLLLGTSLYKCILRSLRVEMCMHKHGVCVCELSCRREYIAMYTGKNIQFYFTKMFPKMFPKMCKYLEMLLNILVLYFNILPDTPVSDARSDGQWEHAVTWRPQRWSTRLYVRILTVVHQYTGWTGNMTFCCSTIW